jgi:hypothetical protein
LKEFVMNKCRLIRAGALTRAFALLFGSAATLQPPPPPLPAEIPGGDERPALLRDYWSADLAPLLETAEPEVIHRSGRDVSGFYTMTGAKVLLPGDAAIRVIEFTRDSSDSAPQ